MAKKVFKYRVYCETESVYTYTWGDSTPTTCPNNNGHTITTDTVSIVDRVSDIVSYGDVSVDNSTSTPLTASAVWVGSAEVVTEYSSLSITVHSDVASTVDGLELQASSDGTNWDHVKKLTNNGNDTHSFTIVSKYFRVKYTNGGVPQTEFRLQTIYHRFRGNDLTSSIDQTVTGSSDVALTRSIIAGKNPSGKYTNVLLDDAGDIKVSSFSKNIFGEGITTSHNIVIQNYTPCGIINDQMYTIYSAYGGTVSSNDNGIDVDLNITSSMYSYCVLRSKRVLKYRPGMVNTFMGSMRFAAPVANSMQFIGIGNASSDLYFAYDGTSFGVRRSTGGYQEVRCLTIDVHENSNNKTGDLTLDGVDYTVDLDDADGIGEENPFTASQIKKANVYGGWNVDQIGEKLIFTGQSVGEKNGVYSYSSNGTSTGTWSRERVGQALTTEFIPQTNWNGNSRMITDIDPTKNNLYEIEYSWFGASNIKFRILNPDNGLFETVHTMRFSNTATQPSLSHPNMFIQQGIASMGSITPLGASSGCTSGSTLGNIMPRPPKYSITNEKSLQKNTEAVILALKNRNSINGITNQGRILISKLTIATEGSKSVKISIIKNPTTVGQNIKTDYQSYNYVDKANSMSMVDKTSLTYTGGSLIDNFYVSRDNHITIDFTGKEIELHQFDVILITAISNGYNVTDLSISIEEDL